MDVSPYKEKDEGVLHELPSLERLTMDSSDATIHDHGFNLLAREAQLEARVYHLQLLVREGDAETVRAIGWWYEPLYTYVCVMFVLSE